MDFACRIVLGYPVLPAAPPLAPRPRSTQSGSTAARETTAPRPQESDNQAGTSREIRRPWS